MVTVTDGKCIGNMNAFLQVWYKSSKLSPATEAGQGEMEMPVGDVLSSTFKVHWLSLCPLQYILHYYRQQKTPPKIKNQKKL